MLGQGISVGTRTVGRVLVTAMAFVGLTGTAVAEVPSPAAEGATASVSGRVTSQDGAPLHSFVIAYDANSEMAGWTRTDDQGDYTREQTTIRYRGRCWKNIAYDGRTLPDGTTRVNVKAGQTHWRVSMALHRRSRG